MRFVRASSLDAHDRKRFNELLPAVDPDVVVEKEFDNYIQKISAVPWAHRLKIVADPLPRLAPEYSTRRKAVRK